MQNDLGGLTEWERFNYLQMQERANEQTRKADAKRAKYDRYRERIEQDEKEREIEGERRRAYLEHYVVPMLDPYTPRRKEVIRRLSRDVQDRGDRLWILGKVAQASALVGKKKRADWDKMGFLERWGDKLMELPEAFIEGSNQVSEAYGDMGRAIGTKAKGRQPDAKTMKFRELLEGAYQSGDPEKTKEDNVFHKAFVGGSKLTPNILIGKAAHSIGGSGLLAGQAGTQMFGPQYNRLLAEGVDEGTAAMLAGGSSAAGGVIESFVPVPGMRTGSIGGVGRSIGGRLAARFGASPGRRAAMEEAGSILAGVLGEAGEEYAQAAIEQGAMLSGAASTGKTEGRSLMEMPKAGFEAFGESVGPIGVTSAFGGGGRVAQALQMDRVKAQILEFASENKTPSRKQWRDMGLPLEENGRVPAEGKRKQQIKEIAETFQQIDAERTSAMERDREQTEETPVDIPEYDPEATPEAPVDAERVVEDEAEPDIDPMRQTPDVEERFARQEGPFVAPQETDLRTRFMDAAKRVAAEKAEHGEEQGPAEGTVQVEHFSEEDINDILEQASEPDGGFPASLQEFLKDESGRLGIPMPTPVDDTVAGMEPEVASEEIKIPDAEIEQQYGEAHGIKHPGILRRMMNRVRPFFESMVRNKQHIPNFNPEQWAVAHEAWRQMDSADEAGIRIAAGDIARTVQHLGKTQYKLFERMLLVRNQLRALNRMEEVTDPETGEASIENVPEPLRHGWKSRAAVEAYEQKLQRLVDQTPKVKAALAMRGKIVRELSTRLVEAGMIPESSLEDVESYVHQQVLMFRDQFATETEKMAQGTGSGTLKGWMKERVVGPEVLQQEYDYNTMFVEPEMAWMSKAHSELFKYEAKKAVEAKYDVARDFIENAENEAEPLSLYAKSRGHAIISEREFYGPRATTVPQAVQAEYEKAMSDNLGLSEEEQDLASGGNGARIMVMPNEIVAQIRADNKGKGTHMGLAIHSDILKSWKAWTLLSPDRIIGYNLRNITGDLDPIIAANPGVLLHVKDAVKEMWAFRDLKKMPSANVMEAMRYGVLNSGFVSQEMNRVQDSKAFKMLKKGRTLNPVKGYLSFARSNTEFRENILRYAAYLQYKKQIKNGKLGHYGASKKKAVLEVQKRFGTEAAAAKLARELLGDYGNLSIVGQELRAHILPFWSFTEVNMTRYPHILKNSFHEGKGRTATGAVLGKIAAARIGMMYGATWVWNNLMYPLIWGDDEKKLGDYDRNGMHILLGTNSDGSVNVFRNIGALSELMSWFGVNEALSLMPRAADGQIKWSEVGTEVATAPLEKMIQMLHPLAKAGYEVPSGKSLFPDPMPSKQRAQDKLSAVFNIVGLSEEAKWIRGKLQGTGEALRPKYIRRNLLGMGVVDERITAVGEILELRNAYLESKGKEIFNPAILSEYKPARDAATYDDKEAFLSWRESYIERHGKSVATERFWEWVKEQDPVVAKLDDTQEWEFEFRFLTEEQKRKYQIVKQTARENQIRMSRWWMEGIAREKKQ